MVLTADPPTAGASARLSSGPLQTISNSEARMKPFVHLVLLGTLLAACAPAQTAATSAPFPAPAAQVPRPDTLSAAPENWWHLDFDEDRIYGMSANRAYRELLAGRSPERTVVVAIIDSGVDVRHVDLAGNLWINKEEVPGNGMDNDGNGYPDDVHGWNFIGGPDGRHVQQDTYEVTRLYAAYHARFADAREDTMSAPTRVAFARYAEIREAFESDRAEALEQLEEILGLEEAITRFTGILRAHLGTDSLTESAVRAVRPTGTDLAQARHAYLVLAENAITAEVVQRQREYLEGRLEYGLNPAFDPRHIVGDDYSNPRERVYGNADVEGPKAEHGTHVAGIVAAGRGNGTGIDGIAPAVRIMVIRAVPDGDERDKDVANAIRYAVDNGADIINMSFGKGYSPQKQVVDDAVRYADQRGVLMIHAAGNAGQDLALNANFPSRIFDDGEQARLWIEVGASSWRSADSLAATFSNYGAEQVDVFAPGVAIHSTTPGDGYQRFDGTSMAAPMVSGLAALLMAYFPEFDTATVRQIILDSAVRHTDREVVLPGGNGETVRFGALSRTGGIVNAYAAVQMAERMRAAVR
jgi:subtilisin family serine protease